MSRSHDHDDARVRPFAAKACQRLRRRVGFARGDYVGEEVEASQPLDPSSARAIALAPPGPLACEPVVQRRAVPFQIAGSIDIHGKCRERAPAPAGWRPRPASISEPLPDRVQKDRGLARARGVDQPVDPCRLGGPINPAWPSYAALAGIRAPIGAQWFARGRGVAKRGEHRIPVVTLGSNDQLQIKCGDGVLLAERSAE